MFIDTIGAFSQHDSLYKTCEVAAFVSFLFLGTIYGVIDFFALIILSVFLNARKH
ncbi:hypothetical protein ACUMG2_001126 [Campylobacter lari]